MEFIKYLSKKQVKKNQAGIMLVVVLLASTIFIALAGGLASLAVYRQRLYNQQIAEQQALHIAEAGVNYYRWHLAHAQEDYYDGTGADPGPPGEPYGPYSHTYTAPSGNLTGTFELEITPPPTGSTIVTIRSTGWVNSYPNIKRTVEVRYGIPSLAQYSFLTHSDVWFGANEHLSGPMHSNGGVRMDGTNDSIVASARNTYICTASHGCNSSNCSAPCTWTGSGCECPGVWGAGPNFSLWQYPVPVVDFDTITMDLAQMKTDAQADGVYLPQSGGGNYGYHIIFLGNGTFDVYKVNSLAAAVWQLNDSWSAWVKQAEQINTETFLANYTIPDNGLIFIEDDVWVEGVVNGRATLAAARLPDNPSLRKSITINGNITYTAYDGSCVLGLIGQKNIKVPRYAPDVLRISAILLAQNGRVFRNYYWPHRITSSIEVRGGIITNQIWTWTWVDSSDNVIDGYINTTSIFDNNVTFAPPPSFPTTGEYAFISWQEK